MLNIHYPAEAILGEKKSGIDEHEGPSYSHRCQPVLSYYHGDEMQ